MVDMQPILESNPQINRKKLEESLELTTKLQTAGLVRHGYTLKMPYTNKNKVDQTKSSRRLSRWD